MQNLYTTILYTLLRLHLLNVIWTKQLQLAAAAAMMTALAKVNDVQTTQNRLSSGQFKGAKKRQNGRRHAEGEDRGVEEDHFPQLLHRKVITILFTLR